MKKPKKGKQRQANRSKKRTKATAKQTTPGNAASPSSTTAGGQFRYAVKLPKSWGAPQDFAHVQQSMRGPLANAWAELITDTLQVSKRHGLHPQRSIAALELIPPHSTVISALRVVQAVINTSRQMEDFSPPQVHRLTAYIHRWVTPNSLAALPWDFVVVLCDKLVYALLAYDAERSDADWALAEFCGRFALSLMEKHAPDDIHLPDAIDLLGTVLLNRRNTDRAPRLRDAEALFKKNLEVAPRHKNFREQKRALLNLGIVNQELARQEPGRLQLAIDYFDQLEDLNERVEPEERLLEQLLTNRGWARVQLPRDEQPDGCRKAVADLQRAVAICRQGHHHPSALASALLHLGVAQVQLTEYEPQQRQPAERSLNEVAALYQRLQNADGYSRAVHSLGLLHARAGDYKSALAHNFEALKARRGRAIEEWETWGNIVELRLQPNMPPFGSADGDDTLLSKMDELAEQLLAHSDPDRALRAHYYGLQLLGHAPHDGPDGVIYQWAERAVSQTESVWAAVADPLVRYHLGRWLGTFYATRLLLGIRRGESADVLLRFAQNGKARTLLLDRQSGQKEVPWEVDCASLTKRLRQSQGSAFIELGISSLGTAALVAYLGRDAELVIETKVLEFREEELVGLLTKPERGWLPYLEALKKADAASQIEKLEACSAAMERILAILHERLLGPVTAGLRSQGVQDLVFSVHGPLAAFPLAATWRTVDGEPRYLIEEFRSISLSPSVTTFVYAEQPRPITTCQYVLGNTRELPREASSDGQRLESIWRRSFTVAAPLKNPSPDEFLQSLDQIDLIHAVCHGEFDPWQLDKSGIQVGGDALLSCARILAEVACKRTALVVLCACRSGRSRSEDFGAEWLGLSGVLLHRGVQSVLAALWDVDYTASFHLSCEFFKHLIDRQQPVAIAASEAMRALLITGRSAKHNADAHWFLEGRDQTMIPRLRRLLDSPWLWACMQSVSVAT